MQRTLTIPSKLEEALEADITLRGLVYESLNQFIPWLEQNNVKFFTEYTDHSLKHVENVLETSDQLIREDCRAIISPGDVAVLIISSLLHDCAMHISEDGFVSLINSDYIIAGFNDKPWSQLWDEFVIEARRWSGRKLMAILGDTKAIRLPNLDSSDFDIQDLTGKEILLIGEFLRRHHHRLAHEISEYGVPGPSEELLKLPEREETKHIINIAGLVARSHGLPLRKCLDYLIDKYQIKREFKKIRPLYIMALLRISDSLQIGSHRAPKQVPKVRRIRSPISQSEWEMNNAIKDVNWTEFPEAVYIIAEPLNISTFLKIKDSLFALQYELDSSWSVISEAFYSEESLRSLGLSIRRIRSNLDDVNEFSKKVDYIPFRAVFEAADSDLLKLLIKPLYGDKPEIGLRELTQNSLDAVSELYEYIKKYPNFKKNLASTRNFDVKIIVRRVEKDWYVEVIDNGIGMTLNTVTDYFLKAGASLRRSEIWRRTFVNQYGKSKVLRSGRFGIGVLSAFLLGDEITVVTRHVSEPADKGISFCAGLDSEVIELREEQSKVGTKISIKINNDTKERLVGEYVEWQKKWTNTGLWDWYCLEKPKLVRMVENEKNILQQKYKLFDMHSKLDQNWRRISHSDFEDIQWTYKTDFPMLTCNGIIVTGGKRGIKRLSYLVNEEFYHIKMPIISVFDFDANLPMNLQRTDLTTDLYPFHNELLEDIIKDFIAFILVTAPLKVEFNGKCISWCRSTNYKGISSNLNFKFYDFGEYNIHMSPWAITNNGLTFALEPKLLNSIKQKYGLFVVLYSYEELKRYQDMSEYEELIGFEDEDIYSWDLHKYLNDQFNGKMEYNVPEIAVSDFHVIFTFFLESSFYQQYTSNRPGKTLKTLAYSNLLTMIDDIPEEFQSHLEYRKETERLRIYRRIFNCPKRFIVSRKIINQINESEKFEGKKLMPDFMQHKVEEEYINENWIVFKYGECPKENFNFTKFAEQNDMNQYNAWTGVLWESYFDFENVNLTETKLFKVWNKIFGKPYIPNSKIERKKIQKKKEIKKYIELWKGKDKKTR